MKILAEIISLTFHPLTFFLFMPFLVMYRQTESGWSALRWELFSCLFIFLGLIILYIGKRKGFFSDYDVSLREQRKLFYIIVLTVAAVYLLVALLFRGMFFPMSIITFGIILGLIVFAIINNYVKASVHAAVSAAYVITIGFLFGTLGFLATFWIPPVVCWSRYTLKKHTAKELIFGIIIGSGVTFITFLMGKFANLY